MSDKNNELTVPDKKLILLDHTRTGPMAAQFYEFLKTRGVGQPRIFKWCAKTVEAMSQGFFPQRGPISVLLVGPSGVGKTHTAEILADFLFGYPEGFSRIDGQDVSLEHSVARITGAPPGYVGYDAEPMITQQKLDYPAYQSILNFALEQVDKDVKKEYLEIQKEQVAISQNVAELSSSKSADKEREVAQKRLTELSARVKNLGIPEYDPKKYRYPSILLLDEIERAHPVAFPNLLFRILDEGKLQLVSKQTNNGSSMLDFRRTVIIATSNLGAEDLKKLFRESSGRSPGYRFVNEKYSPEEFDRAIYRICRGAADNFFSAPFINRFGDVIAARPLSKENLFEILEIELKKLHKRLFNPADLNFPVMIRVDDQVKQYLVETVLDSPEKGVRFFQHKLHDRILTTIPLLKATAQICKGDILHVSLTGKELLFWREDRARGKGKIIIG